MSGSGRRHYSKRDFRDDSEFARSSRSRSPACDFRRDSGVNDRKRTRTGGLTQPCRDFPSGNCRRGSHCHFLHHDNQNYEDGRESRHRQDGSPRYDAPRHKYVHHDNSDWLGNVGESTRERDIDRRRMENSFEHGGARGPNRSSDTPCKFFAFGNCRNGRHCRFSHDRQVCKSPDRRLRDDRSRSNQGRDQPLEMPKLNDSIIPDNGRLKDDNTRGLDSNMAEVNEIWDGPKQNDFVAAFDTAKPVEDNKNGIVVAPRPGFTGLPMSDGWDHGLDNNRVHVESSFPVDKKETNFWEAENAGAVIGGGSQSISTDIWPGDEKMSPDWKYGQNKQQVPVTTHPLSMENPFTLPAQNQVFKQNPVIALTCEDKSDTNKGSGSLVNPNFPTFVLPGQGFNQNPQNLNASHPSRHHVVGQSQVAVSIVPPRVGSVVGMHNQEISTEKRHTVEPNTMEAILAQVASRNPSNPNMVSEEQIAHLTSISASLAHILGSVQQLPQLQATVNSAVGLQKQYDPMCDSIEPKKANASDVPPSVPPIKNVTQNAAEGENIEDNKGKNVVAAEERKGSQSANRITKENSPSQNGGADDAKNNNTKDVKGVRAFKYSLVEFVKELLKPTWKEGKITKEDYKSIVKKVADKVTGTVQRVNIPQTQEKIDHYLSLSKPKLSKLLQAYVEKAQKA